MFDKAKSTKKINNVDIDKIKNSPFSLYGDQKYKPETIKNVQVTSKKLMICVLTMIIL